MEQHVNRIDKLDNDIATQRDYMKNGIPMTDEDIEKLFANVLLRNQLDTELKHIRNGKFL